MHPESRAVRAEASRAFERDEAGEGARGTGRWRDRDVGGRAIALDAHPPNQPVTILERHGIEQPGLRRRKVPDCQARRRSLADAHFGELRRRQRIGPGGRLEKSVRPGLRRRRPARNPGSQRPARCRPVRSPKLEGYVAAGDQGRPARHIRDVNVQQATRAAALARELAGGQPREVARRPGGQWPDALRIDLGVGPERDQPSGQADRAPRGGCQRRHSEQLEKAVDHGGEAGSRVRSEERRAGRHQKRQQPPTALVRQAVGERRGIGERRFEPVGIDGGRWLPPEGEVDPASGDGRGRQSHQQHLAPPALHQRERRGDQPPAQRLAVELGVQASPRAGRSRIVEADCRDFVGHRHHEPWSQRCVPRRAQRNDDGVGACSGCRRHVFSPGRRGKDRTGPVLTGLMPAR
jgi:hypothetical protein